MHTTKTTKGRPGRLRTGTQDDAAEGGVLSSFQIPSPKTPKSPNASPTRRPGPSLLSSCTAPAATGSARGPRHPAAPEMPPHRASCNPLTRRGGSSSSSSSGRRRRKVGRALAGDAQRLRPRRAGERRRGHWRRRTSRRASGTPPARERPAGAVGSRLGSGRGGTEGLG